MNICQETGALFKVKAIVNDFSRNVAAGMRLIIFHKIGAGAFHAGPVQLLLVIPTAFALTVVAIWAVAGPESQLHSYGLGHFIGSSAVFLLACYLAAVLLRRTELFGRFFIAFGLGQASLYIIAAAVLTKLPMMSDQFGLIKWPPAYWTFFACTGVVAYRATHVVFQRGRVAATAATAGMLAVFIGYSILPGAALRYPSDPKSALRPVNVEAIYYRQKALLDQAIGNLAPQRPGSTDMYFVAFGGDAHLDVFLRETLSISELFDNRFGTAGRSLRLVNNPATTKQYPLASTHNLSATLRQIGKRLDPREDILFLFLTSHGAPEWLSVKFEPLRLNNLSARALRRMLDKSGIKWRVIVVSACFSGSFIDDLADDKTLVITAARHDRMSFGCAHESEFSYFGRAYFDDALRETFSFTDAFKTAAEAIEKLERSEGLDPSFPQIAIGKAIAPKLNALARDLRRRAGGKLANQPQRR